MTVFFAIVGVLLTAIGAFLLGRWWEARVSDALRLQLAAVQAELEQVQTEKAALVEQALRNPDLDPDVTPVRSAPTPEQSPVPVHTMEILLEADAPEEVAAGDLTRKISLDSTEHVLALSQHVEALSEDVSRLRKELASAQRRVQELEEESAERLRKNAELERRVERLKSELRRREDKLRVLMAEVGIQLGEDEISVAMESLTTKTRKVDISELEGRKESTS